MLIVSFDVGIKNLAYSIIKFNGLGETTDDSGNELSHSYKVINGTSLQEWHKVDLQSNKYNLETITSNLLEVLDTIAYQQIESIHNEKVHVVIENQPALKSPTMKSIQIVIYAYFNTIAKYNSLDLCTKLISAKSKLKYIDTFADYAIYMNALQEQALNDQSIPGTKMKRIPKQKQGYAKNKDDSVQFTRWLLDHVTQDTKHKEELEQLKKKDDVCDSYLQGMYYITSLKQSI
jgi:hypothetical protein